jgi:hypothetical protein
MGREIKRVPLDFVFPLGASYYDAAYDAHCGACSKEDHDECKFNSQPPKGDGWQLWQTVSDGPITPVFATADALIDYMCRDTASDRPWATDWRRETATKFVNGPGWAPSFAIVDGQFMSGPDFVTSDATKGAR